MLTTERRLALESERRMAESALRKNNIGKARVCCRRAVGVLMEALAEQRAEKPEPHALAWLRKLANDHALPDDVRDAAQRLLAKRSEVENTQASTDPLGDLDVIQSYVLSLLHDGRFGSKTSV